MLVGDGHVLLPDVDGLLQQLGGRLKTKISKLINTPAYLEVVIRHACEVLSGDVHSLILRGEVSKSHLSLEKQ